MRGFPISKAWQSDMADQPASVGYLDKYNVMGVPCGTRIAAYVRSTGNLTSDWSGLPTFHTTLNSALAKCEDGVGDTVVVLPGHAESITGADQMSSLVAGTRIVGLGWGNNRPTFTWTITASSFLLDVANVTLENMILNLDPGTGTVNVTAPITISGAGCGILGCKVRTSTDANSKSAIPITTTAAADDLVLAGNHIYGATAGECTTAIQLVGADRLKMYNNRIVVATSNAAVGSLRFLTTASLDVDINGLVCVNNKASSTVAITGMAGLTGTIDNVLMGLQINDTTYALRGGLVAPTDLAIGSNMRTDVNV